MIERYALLPQQLPVFAADELLALDAEHSSVRFGECLAPCSNPFPLQPGLPLRCRITPLRFNT